MKIRLKSYKLLFRLLDLLSNSKWLHKLVINKKVYLGASIISLSMMSNSCSSYKGESKKTEDKKDSTIDNLKGNDIPKSKKDSISRKKIKTKSTDSNIDVEVMCYKTTIDSDQQENSSAISVKNDSIIEDTTEDLLMCYVYIEPMPEFPGGDEARIKYLSANLTRPKGTSEISGTVYIEFTISKNGKISNPIVKRGIHPLLDAEALRVVKNMPDWVYPPNYRPHSDIQFVLPFKFLAE